MALEGVASGIGRMLQKIFGSRNERLVRAYGQVAREVGPWEERLSSLRDDELPTKTAEFRRRLAAGETLEDILPEAFALVRIAADRAIGLRPYDVQLVGGQVLYEGKIAEMVTGEGKTLVAVLPNYLRALAGKVHLVTVNDFLVRRDAEWMGPVYRMLGLTVGHIQTPMDPAQRIPEYACDITYGTNNEFGFDYLRDNMKTTRAEQAQGPLNYVIVDEVDSVLIDEARTPLIISGPAFESTEKYGVADQVARRLRAPRRFNVPDSAPDRDPDADFTVMEKEHTCSLTEKGQPRAEQLVGVSDTTEWEDGRWEHHVKQALRAHYLYHRDVDYVVQDDEVIIVDEFTGRLMPGRQWSDGLHQAVEAKEGITIKEETQTLATITFQNFFKLYDRLAGMTGTAITEAEEFYKIYKLEVVSIPTNRPLNRVSHSDVVFLTMKEKFTAIVDEVNSFSKRGRPVLVGTISIETSERLSNLLMRTHGVEHEVLSAKYHQREAEIVADAGQQHTDRSGHLCGNVTIATNMAGRGTDIKLAEAVVCRDCHGPWDITRQDRPADFGNKCCINCPEYDGVCAHCFKPKRNPEFPARGRNECRQDPPCGLHIVGTERHEARRIDNQLRGRSGRQGDPGSSRFFLSLEDDLMRIFAKAWVTNILRRLGMEEGMSLEHGFLSRGIEKAQRRVEEHNFSIRKNLLEYDEVMDSQRKVFYGQRQAILEADTLRPIVWEMLVESLQKMLDDVLRPEYPYECIADWARRTLQTTVKVKTLEGRSAEELESHLKDRAADDARDRVAEAIDQFYVMPDVSDDAGPDVEAEGDAELDYKALARWARDRLGVEVRESELRDMDVNDIQDRLQEAAAERVQQTDCSTMSEFLDEDYPLRVLAEWLRRKLELEVSLDDLRARQRPELEEWLLQRLGEVYDRKERTYPIEHAIEECLNPQRGSGSFDFEALARWASWYYCADVTESQLKLDDFEKIRRRLLQIAEASEQGENLGSLVERGLARYLSTDDAVPTEHNLPAIRTWAAEVLGVELDDEELQDATRGTLADLLYRRACQARRSDMNNLERYLLLQVYDTSWKEHLYVMDHLKSGVGLRGYAQVDPKIEYKREGLRQFQEMLDGINDRFTDLFFKARWVQRETLGRIWSGQSAEHEEFAPGLARFDEQRQAALEGLKRQDAEKPKPIIRTQTKVGRNDPCPCGSGKKYKKCCGRNA